MGSLPSELKASYIVPEGLLKQLISSSQRLERILADPRSHLLEQVEKALRTVLDDASLPVEQKNEEYERLLALQSQIKDGTAPSLSIASAASPQDTTDPVKLPAENREKHEQSPPTLTSSLDTAAILSGVHVRQRGPAEQFLGQLQRHPKLFGVNARGKRHSRRYDHCWQQLFGYDWSPISSNTAKGTRTCG